MRDPDSGPSWKTVLVADRWRLLGLGFLVLGATLVLGVDVAIPRWAVLCGTVAAVSSLLAYAPAARIVAYLYRPTYVHLVELDPESSDLAVWALPPDEWRDLEVTEGELFSLQAALPAWECQAYDPETNTATGTWRGSASDLELIRERGRIAEIRGTLEDLAKEGLGYRVMQSGIVRAAVRSVVISFVEAFERDAVYDGDEIRQAVDRTLDDWSFEPATDPEAGIADDGSLAVENVEGEPSSTQHETEGVVNE
jgi:hypothetical protein